MDMKTMRISFCKKSGLNVIEADDKQQIIDILDKSYSINFKTNRAMILNKKSLAFLRVNPHLISIKTTGSNYYLFLTRINDTNCCFFIDRKIKNGYTLPRIILANLSFGDEAYNDTLIDGELIRDKKNNWMFLIGDMLVYKGERLKENIVGRFKKIYELLGNDFTEDPNMDICPIRVKKLFSYNDFNQLIMQYIPRLEYSIRGLYFNTLNPKHCNQLFIYKENNKNVVKKKEIKKENTTDESRTFEIRTTMQPEIYDLYKKNKETGEMVRFEVAHVSGLKASRLLKAMFDTKDKVYVKCLFNKKFNKWEPFQDGNPEDTDEI